MLAAAVKSTFVFVAEEVVSGTAAIIPELLTGVGAPIEAPLRNSCLTFDIIIKVLLVIIRIMTLCGC